mmetsp:Transcript_8358/g.25117  ORF Transcript_8358/g.25117 Transcript_8358/m.25117 type:complete len:214 (-) Transcript_8358:228-869(-)
MVKFVLDDRNSPRAEQVILEHVVDGGLICAQPSSNHAEVISNGVEISALQRARRGYSAEDRQAELFETELHHVDLVDTLFARQSSHNDPPSGCHLLIPGENDVGQGLKAVICGETGVPVALHQPDARPREDDIHELLWAHLLDRLPLVLLPDVVQIFLGRHVRRALVKKVREASQSKVLQGDPGVHVVLHIHHQDLAHVEHPDSVRFHLLPEL